MGRNEPGTLVTAGILLMLSTLAASYVPARRAMRGGVAAALRQGE